MSLNSPPYLTHFWCSVGLNIRWYTEWIYLWILCQFMKIYWKNIPLDIIPFMICTCDPIVEPFWIWIVTFLRGFSYSGGSRHILLNCNGQLLGLAQICLNSEDCFDYFFDIPLFYFNFAIQLWCQHGGTVFQATALHREEEKVEILPQFRINSPDSNYSLMEETIRLNLDMMTYRLATIMYQGNYL